MLVIVTVFVVFHRYSCNVFSSLEGIEFIWELKTVEGVGSVKAQSVLR